MCQNTYSDLDSREVDLECERVERLRERLLDPLLDWLCEVERLFEGLRLRRLRCSDLVKSPTERGLVGTSPSSD